MITVVPLRLLYLIFSRLLGSLTLAQPRDGIQRYRAARDAP
jgi:hypothetical protein